MSSTQERLSMPGDICASTALTIITPSRSCVPSLRFGLKGPRNCLGLFRMKLPTACCGVFAKENKGRGPCYCMVPRTKVLRYYWSATSGLPGDHSLESSLFKMTFETCTRNPRRAPLFPARGSVHMVVWRRPDFLLPVELSDLPHQFADVCPPRPVHRRDPARPQIAVTVHQEFHVFR